MTVTDEQLAVQAAAGDQDAMRALLDRYSGIAFAIADRFYDQSADRDDLRQEARLGIWYAIRDYRAGGLSLTNFVALVVKRHLIDCMKAATRGKHLALTQSDRVVVNEEGDELSAAEQIPAAATDPVDLLGDRASLATVLRVVSEGLSPLERTVLLAIANGERHLPLQLRLGIPPTRWPDGRPRAKSVENAWQRAQTKIRDALALEDMAA